MNPAIGFLAVLAVSAATALISFYGLRISRTTDDFYVASRSVPPWLNASAMGGEYLSAASFLGIAGLIMLTGINGLWFPIGYTAGYLMLLFFVAAPLRRSGAYTVPDFAHARLASPLARHVTSILIVVIGWFYIVPQLHGASLTILTATGLPSWVGAVAVMLVVILTVVAGGMRSITLVQSFQYWLKLTAMAVPVMFILLMVTGATGTPAGGAPAGAEFFPDTDPASRRDLYGTLSLLVALMFGTLGLPHVLARFYTNPDGASARRTTLLVLGLLSVFYLFPTVFGVVGRVFLPELVAGGSTDTAVLLLPGTLIGGLGGSLLSALVVAGAFAAFLSTTSGLVVSLAGVASQELFGGGIRGFRIAAVAAAVVPLGLALVTGSPALAQSVGLVFALTASTVGPLLLLGIWWRGLTDAGAVAGMLAGGLLCLTAMVAGPLLGGDSPLHRLLAEPAAWTVPTAFATMVLVSLATRGRRNPGTARFMTKLHVPERPHAVAGQGR
ncbi:transporter [Arthrobacter sp. ERGS1:01]|uniref:sodium/solute symporter n=1 Tax=Arthrobacter sp. ERGS1:01 TaxID=1704044 RepID=UPI0006B5E0D1|nr:cation acetate symporter [Arthrobacter sp. ERGS1:01]ALE05286.1 transporter [Arthrobacter sp. ERGS1:01]